MNVMPLAGQNDAPPGPALPGDDLVYLAEQILQGQRSAKIVLRDQVYILRLTRAEAGGAQQAPLQPLSQESVFTARREILELHMADAIEQYIVQLVVATREAHRYSEQLGQWIEFGGSPRATIALDRCARAHAWLHGQDFVSPDDVQAVAADVLRHRLLLSFEAEANGVDTDQVVRELLTLVPVG